MQPRAELHHHSVQTAGCSKARALVRCAAASAAPMRAAANAQAMKRGVHGARAPPARSTPYVHAQHSAPRGAHLQRMKARGWMHDSSVRSTPSPWSSRLSTRFMVAGLAGGVCGARECGAARGGAVRCGAGRCGAQGAVGGGVGACGGRLSAVWRGRSCHETGARRAAPAGTMTHSLWAGRGPGGIHSPQQHPQHTVTRLVPLCSAHTGQVK
jgi:hypothetical protein